LCKKRAKHEALAKENSNAFINPNNKRVLVDNSFQTQGTVDVGSPLKKLRYNLKTECPIPSSSRAFHNPVLLTIAVIFRRAHIPNATANCTSVNMLHKESGLREQQLRAPFAILAQNVHNVDNSQVTTPKECLINGKVF